MPADQRARLKQWLESGEARLHPLTFPQRELWEASPVPVEDNANHICCLIEVHGLLTEARVPRRDPASGRSPGGFASLVPSRQRASAADDPQELRDQFWISRSCPSEARPEAIEELAAGDFPRAIRPRAGAALSRGRFTSRGRTTTCWSSRFITPLPTAGVWGFSSRICSPLTSRA